MLEIGHKVGRLTVIAAMPQRGHVWVRCDCGKELDAKCYEVERGRVKSCGCAKAPVDIIGQVFGQLTAVRRAKNGKSSAGSYWECRCSCGKTSIARGVDLRAGKRVSCGCSRSSADMRAKAKREAHKAVAGEAPRRLPKWMKQGLF